MNAMLKRENPTNKFITEKQVEQILAKYGVPVKVKNISIYRHAFVHRSYLKNSNSGSGTGSGSGSGSGSGTGSGSGSGSGGSAGTGTGSGTGTGTVSGSGGTGSVTTDTPMSDVIPLQEKCNERIELLGDCILGAVVGTYLFQRYSNESEGFLTKTKTKIVRRKNLGKLGRRLGLGEWIIISQHVENEKGRENTRILEDIFECFIGALYLDNGSETVSTDWITKYAQLEILNKKIDALDASASSSASVAMLLEYRKLANEVINFRNNCNGYMICQKFILNVLEKEIDLVRLIKLEDNYKDQLQNYFQLNHKIPPEWRILCVEGPTNNRIHTVGVHNERGQLIGVGKARKKLRAEQLASKEALKFLGKEVMSDSDESDSD